ncbi:hypothetical protein B9Z19DRAFT_1135954 [Tuber borchii]|uniref:Uncharacterized protein n=1 Tax=Tuber borchii TaxID=42251 RepID=A0A2T6ZCB3_TUBBO|nr:hypothetical protein B9Z19DRAFT_1135954 [Tuber borchii]
MGTDGIEGGFISISAITRPGFSDETLLSHSGTDQMQEWAGSAYRTPELPVSRYTNTRYRSAGEPYLDPPVDPHPRRLSRESTAPLSHHLYPINPLRIGEQLVSNIPPPATINLRATYSSYPLLPLPPREQTYRPWSLDVSEDGAKFISLGDCDLGLRSKGDKAGPGSRAWIGGPGGRLNTVGEPVMRIRGSKSGSDLNLVSNTLRLISFPPAFSFFCLTAVSFQKVTATSPAGVQEGYIESSDSSSQRPVTGEQRTSQQRPQNRHTQVETSTDDASIADGGLFTGGKKEQTMIPTKRDRKTQHSRATVPPRVMKASTTAAEELTLTGKAGVAPTADSTPYKKEGEDKMDDDSFLASQERAVTPAPRRLTPIVEIIVPAVPRTVPKVLTGVEQVGEKRRSHGRPRKIGVSDEAVTSEKNTITDAGLYTDPVVALGWLVPYNRGEPICLPGCQSLPGTIGCLRCFDTIFPGRREREGLNPEMVFRRLRPGTSFAALSPREAQGVQGLHSLLALAKASANKSLPFPALKKEAEVLSSLPDPTRKRKTPTPSLSGLSERSYLSTMPAKNPSPALRERRSTISTSKPQALEKPRLVRPRLGKLRGPPRLGENFQQGIQEGRSKKPPAKKKAVVTLPGFHSKHSPECEDESGSEDQSKPEDSSEAEDGLV